MKAEGTRAGVPDIVLLYPVRPYHGLIIEMKAKGGSLSDLQKAWLCRLSKAGYQTAVCFGWSEAVEVLLNYLNPGAT